MITVLESLACAFRRPVYNAEHPPTWLVRVTVPGAATAFDVLFYRDEAAWYVAEVPELPGCVSQGETLDELLANVREAAELVLEARLADGLPEREDLSQPTPVLA